MMPETVAPKEETAGEMEKKLARIIINKISSSKTKMDKMAADVAAMMELQEGLLAKIASIPDDQEGVRKILYGEARKELETILEVKNLLDITIGDEAPEGDEETRIYVDDTVRIKKLDADNKEEVPSEGDSDGGQRSTDKVGRGWCSPMVTRGSLISSCRRPGR